MVKPTEGQSEDMYCR